MVVGLFWNKWSFLALISLIHFGCWIEFFRIIEAITRKTLPKLLRTGVMVMGYSIMLFFCGDMFEIDDYHIRNNLPLIFGLAGLIVAGAGILSARNVSKRAFFYSLAGWIYISLSCGLLISLYDLNMFSSPPNHWKLIFLPAFVIGCMWVNDTMAYIVGSLVGRIPLSRISPKKTLEGTVGGIILCSLIMGLIGSSLDEGAYSVKNLAFWSGLALVAAVIGTSGDLLESKLKREAGLKDSGSFMPGHGGFLDRFDSLLLATPFCWLYLKFVVFYS